MYSKLPETLETVHAKEASELQSQVQEAEIEFKLWNSGVFTAIELAWLNITVNSCKVHVHLSLPIEGINIGVIILLLNEALKSGECHVMVSS